MFLKIWNTAAKMAEQTPEQRNRYVDFLRALSIIFVIAGHWLIAAAIYNQQTSSLDPVDVLTIMPSAQWITWIFQVMPVFFIVGGYSNAISLKSAQAKKLDYAQWLAGRLHRLLTPLLVLILSWVVISVLMKVGGAKTTTIKFATRAAMIPCWFLAIYTMIVMLAPLAFKFWRRWGWYSWMVLVLLAVLVDVVFFNLDMQWLGWTNYFWVWLAVHHLGFAWFDNKLAKPLVMFAVGMLALTGLYALVEYGPYPLAMAASPDKAVSNSLPPKITLIVLGLCQFGLLHAFEKPMQGLLQGKKLWTLVVLISSMIMSLYLWHMTVLLLTIEASYLLGGLGMHIEPATQQWWLTRPLWIGLLTLLLIPIALLMSPLERLSRPKSEKTPSAIRLVIGASLAGLGIALVVVYGFEGTILNLETLIPVGLLLLGTYISGVKLLPSRTL